MSRDKNEDDESEEEEEPASARSAVVPPRKKKMRPKVKTKGNCYVCPNCYFEYENEHQCMIEIFC